MLSITGTAVPKAWQPAIRGHCSSSRTGHKSLRSHSSSITYLLPGQPVFVGICIGKNGLNLSNS